MKRMGTGKIIVIVALIIAAVAAMCAAGIIIYRRHAGDGSADTDDAATGSFSGKKITSLEKLTLHVSGMRGAYEYEIVCENGEATVSYYGFYYNNGEEERRLEESATLDEKTVVDKLNEFGVGKWDGFDGPHPKGVLDGKQFRFEAIVNGGDKISAEGSQNFPKNYSEFESWMYGLLNG